MTRVFVSFHLMVDLLLFCFEEISMAQLKAIHFITPLDIFMIHPSFASNQSIIIIVLLWDSKSHFSFFNGLFFCKDLFIGKKPSLSCRLILVFSFDVLSWFAIARHRLLENDKPSIFSNLSPCRNSVFLILSSSNTTLILLIENQITGKVNSTLL